MSDRRLAIEIEVTGNAATVFKAIGQAAKDAAKDVTDSGDKAEKGFVKVEDAADDSASAVERLEKAQAEAARATEAMAQQASTAASSIDGMSTNLDPVSGKFDNVRDSTVGVEEAMSRLKDLYGEHDQIGWIPPDIDQVPGALNDVRDAADGAVEPLDSVSQSFDGLGKGIKEIGSYLPGTLGDVTTSVGDVAKHADFLGVALGSLFNAGKSVATALGPVGLVASLTTAGISALYLTGVLGGTRGIAHQLDDIRRASDEAAASINSVAFSMSDAATGFDLASSNAALETYIDDMTRLYEIGTVMGGNNNLGDFASGAVDGIGSLNEAVTEAIRIQEKHGIANNTYIDDLGLIQTAIEGAAAEQELFSSIMNHTGPGAADARARLAELNEQYARGAIDQETYNWNLQWMNENLVTHYDMLAAAKAAQRQFAEQAFNTAASVGLLDTALEQMTLAGLQTDATMVALGLSTSSLDNTFQTIVGTTNQLAAGSQAVADWAMGLADASEGMSTLGKLYAAGLITLDQYSAGIASATRIQADNALIQTEIQGIQAQHLPLMAELTEQQRQYIQSLGDLSSEQQIAALGFMDNAQSAKAMELAYLAADAASGALGATGVETATRIIEAAANADPVMKQMLLDMGLISEGAEGTVEVKFPNASSLTSSVDGLTASIDALTLALGGIPPSVTTDITANDYATNVISKIQTALANLDGSSASVYIAGIGGGLTIGTGATGTHIFPESARNLVAKVDAMATGGHLTLVGEAGPELVQLPTGSTVTNAAGTRGRLDPQGRGRRSAGGGDVYNGTVHMTVVRDDSALTHRQRELAKRRR